MKKAIFIIVFLTSGICSFSQTVQERDSLARDTHFQLKVRMAALSAANDLLADTTVASYVTNYAQLIVTSPTGGNWVNVFSFGVVNNPAITFSSSQADIQFTVNSVFVKYAKAEYRIITR
jgi:hypothetical protein